MGTVKLKIAGWLFSCAVLSTAAEPAFGFGRTAHRIVGHITAEYLCKPAATEFARLSPDADLSEAGLWADIIRGDPDWENSKPWHYINVADDQDIATAERNPAGDILSALAFFLAELGATSRSDAERRVALYFVVHLVADIHQPLHVGRANDRGGNTVLLLEDGELSNLHRFWDSQALGRVWNTREYAAELLADASAMRNAIPSDDTPLNWARESQSYRQQVYEFKLDSMGFAELDARYRARSRMLIRQRLLQAGIRLAVLLNEHLCPATMDCQPCQRTGE